MRAVICAALAAMALGWAGCDETPSARDGGGGRDGRADAPGDARRDAGQVGEGGVEAARRDGAPAEAGRDAAADAAADAAIDPCAKALVCEGFESFSAGQSPPAPWLTRESGGTVAVDGTRAYSGTQSVKFTTNTAGSGSFRRALIGYEGAPLFPAAADQLYGRMMIWLDEAPTGSVHWTNVQGEGDVPGQSYRALIRYGGQQSKRMMANYETQGVGSDCWQHSQTLMPEKRWACIEWHFDRTKDQMHLWLDGIAITDLTVTAKGSGCISNGTSGNWYFPLFDRIYVGWEHYQQTTQRTLWIDDVAFGDRRIGCPP